MKEGIAGERFIISQESVDLRDIAKMLEAELNPLGYRVQTRSIGRCPLKIASLFDPQVKSIMNLIGQRLEASNNKSREVLGVLYERDLK